MFTIENVVGRFCELRVDGRLTLPELPEFKARVASVMLTTPGRTVWCADVRRLAVLPPEVFEPLVAILRTDNPKVERNGILVSSSSTALMQMQRMIQEAGSPSRQVFREEQALKDWLGEVLTPAERARLERFVAGPAR
jgi:hypothetical protein